MDASLCEVLREMEFEKKYTNDHVLQIALDRDSHYNFPEGYKVGGMELGFDLWKCQLVLHKGFDHEDEGLPQPLDPDTFVLAPSKSVTAIIGFTHEDTTCHIARCMTCTAKNCPFRKED